MKIILLLFTWINMNISSNPKFEDLIGKEISLANSIFDTEFKNNLSGLKNLYIAYLDSPKRFFNQQYSILSITVDDNNLINSITIHFLDVFDYCFFSSFNKEYHTPYKILVIDNKKVINKEKSGARTITQSQGKLQEGNFEDRPLFIYWENKSFQIKAFFRYKQNVSEITFGKSLIPEFKSNE